MKIFRKNNLNRIIILNLIILMLFGIVITVFTHFQYIQYMHMVNNSVNIMIDNISKEYPDVKLDNILDVLNSKNLDIANNELIKKYGIDIKNMPIIADMEKLQTISLIQNICIFVVFAIVMLVIYLFYSLKKATKLQQITDYIQEINNGNYYLDIEDNGEGELSLLKNELYKTTVMLKEQAINSAKDKQALTVWMQDISHQLKTPLTSINIMIDSLKNDTNMPNSVRHEFITEIAKQIEGINFLVLSLLKLSKFDANVVEFNDEKICVHTILNNVIKRLDILFEVKNVTVEFKNNDKDVFFFGDYNWEMEALTNIVKNCIEHTPQNKKIYIDYMQNNFYTSIKISDEGIGIDEQELKHIFKRFYKGKNSNEDSIGIGLALSKSIIEKDNGYICVTSQIGKGTTFEIKYMRKYEEG